MLLDGRSVRSGEVLRFDVCVIGAGPAGILLAGELGVAGCRVLLLERGDAEWNGKDRPNTAFNVGLDYDPGYARTFGFGGSANEWNVHTPWGDDFCRLREMDDEDFLAREWVPYSGWPFDKAHLRPFYDRAWSLIGYGSLPERREDLCQHELNKNPFSDPQGIIEESLFLFFRYPIPAARKRLLESEAVTVMTNSTAVEIRSDESLSTVSSLRVASAPSNTFCVDARHFVLAAGAIENARLMLASRSRQAKGVGNEHDVVGRFFLEHPHYTAGILFPEDPALLTDPVNYAIHMHDRVRLQKKYVLTERAVRAHELLRSCFLFEARPLNARIRRAYYGGSATRSINAAANVSRAVLGRPRASDAYVEFKHALVGIHHVGRFAVDLAVDRTGRPPRFRRPTLPQILKISVMAEQAPNPRSRVRLSEARDAYGVPIARVNWQLTDKDFDSMHRSQTVFAQALLAAGHRRVDSVVKRSSLPPQLTGGPHQMGTTRMSDSPRYGVVDRNCRVHGVDNLYVAGSSVFPTVGYANPVMTIMALTMRLAAHLRDDLLRD
jgi:choline dehydrogenase-like flavoprotein